MNDKNLLAILWLKNGIYALALAGIYSIVLVLLRTPQLSFLLSNKDIFKTSLIVHVNLSVLVWLLSIICVFWSYQRRLNMLFDSLYAKLSFVGMILMAIAPMIGQSVPIMNNYVPMLENISFIIGLSLFAVSILIYSILTFVDSVLAIHERQPTLPVLSVFKITTSTTYILACGCFVLSYLELEKVRQLVPLDLDFYYELLFWSGGHLLQFLYTQGLMLALFILLEAIIRQNLRLTQSYTTIFILNFVLGLGVFIGHLRFEIIDGAFKEYFTQHMIYAGGIAPMLYIFTLAYEYFTLKAFIVERQNQIYYISKVALFSALLLFLSGGLIGAMISGVNVTIPAHYHGSIVGITVAFMGIVYIYCYRSEQNGKSHIINLMLKANVDGESNGQKTTIANNQIILFTLGQILHITGLALAGGYGVMRKAPGVEIPLSAKVYMGMVGGGGLIAIIGGLMFVYICVKKLPFIKW